MSWEDKIAELSDYELSFEIKQGYYHIALRYKDGWEVLEPENAMIYAEKRNGIWHYLAPIGDVTADDIFKCVEETIKYNKDLERKLELFKEMTTELQTIFANEDYETLKTIQFKFKKKKATNTAKPKQKEEPAEETVEKHREEPVKEEETKQEEKPNNGFIDDEDDVVTIPAQQFIEEVEK